MHNKMNYARTVYTMLDDQVRPNYNLENEMPVIQPYIMENTNTLINLSLVLTHVQESSFTRCMVFVTGITTVYALNFLYVTLHVLFMGEGL